MLARGGTVGYRARQSMGPRLRKRGTTFRRAVGLLSVLAALTAASTSHAQGVGTLVAMGGAGPAEGETRPSLRERFGLVPARKLLDSEDSQERLRGIERLGALGSDDAIAALGLAMEQGAGLGRDPLARLLAVRTLAPFAAKTDVMRLLLREVTDTAGEGQGETAMQRLTRQTAALALARGGGAEAVAALARIVASGGAAAEVASNALFVYPPRDLGALLGKGNRPLTPPIIALLGDLGDKRAAVRLRAVAKQKDPTTAAAAVRSLALIGDEAALPLARSMRGSADDRLAMAGSEALALLGALDASIGISGLLRRETTRSFALKLSLRSPDPALAAELVRTLATAKDDELPLVVAALGRTDTAAAVPPLLATLERPALALAAAHALATMPGEVARDALAAQLDKTCGTPGPRCRLVLRAAVTRGLALGDAPDGTSARLDVALASKDAADRALGAFGLVALGLRDAEPFATSRDDAIFAAAIRGALTRDPYGAGFSLPIFAAAAEKDPGSTRAIAASAALLARPDAEGISATTLALWSEAGTVFAPLSARALARRDQPALRPRIEGLLHGSDPLVRAHTALGLAASPSPDATALLIELYNREDETVVRRAALRALAERPEKLRLHTLEMAQNLDPDDVARAIARGGLRADRRTSAGIGKAVLWLSLASNEPATKADVPPAAALLLRDGVVAPLVADPDGALTLGGLDDGSTTLVLAPRRASRDAPAR